MPIVNCQMSPASRGSVSLGAWFGFAFLAAVLCELCGKEELNREERQGFAKDAKQLLWPRDKPEPLPAVAPLRLSQLIRLGLKLTTFITRMKKLGVNPNTVSGRVGAGADTSDSSDSSTAQGSPFVLSSSE